MSSGSSGFEQAQQLLTVLQQRQLKIVFAESCTCGLLAATIGRVPGASQVVCGSAVTYRNATKAEWLRIDPAILADPAVGPVSEIVAREMAWQVLQQTPEADLAVSVTGHLGPGAPAEQDGLVISGWAKRGTRSDEVQIRTYHLPTAYPLVEAGQLLRHLRQDDLVQRIFSDLLNALA